MVQFNRDEFWAELTGQRDATYEARAIKESRIQSPALKYLHRLMAHSLFPKKDGDSVVTTTKLSILFCICNNIQLDICHALALKLKDVANKSSRAIKVGGLITNMTCYVGFDVDNLPF